jgi:HlyD family secretion protein
VPSKRLQGLSVLAIAVAAAVAWGFWPRAEPVETATVARRSLEITVEEEGRTRVRDRYVLYAPVAGYLRRIDLEVGDPAPRGTTLGTLDPLRPATLDQRSRAEAEARVAAARAELQRREAAARQAAAEAGLAAAEFTRSENLLARRLVSQSQHDAARSRSQATAAGERAAAAAIEVGRHELESALAALRYTASGEAGPPLEAVPLRSPLEGRVLKVHQESAGVVAAGQPLIEVGDPSALEVEVEVLSRDAVRIQPGRRVRLERWGGEDVLEAAVRTVEPTGFTKVSALGVEEQRVRVIADFTSPPEAWQRLGDGYRVEAAFVVWERADALTVPANAVFRRDAGWAVFAVENGRARERPVAVGPGNGLLTEITDGLEEGATVIVHPGDAIADGVRVRAFRAP